MRYIWLFKPDTRKSLECCLKQRSFDAVSLCFTRSQADPRHSLGDKASQTALHRAVARKNLDIASMLLTTRATEAINARDQVIRTDTRKLTSQQSGATPLHIAIDTRQKDMVQKLLEAKAEAAVPSLSVCASSLLGLRMIV